MWRILVAGLLAQSSVLAETIPFDSPRWDIQGQTAELVEIKGSEALKLQGGGASIKDLQLTEGVIEFDMLFNEERGFSGAVFRMRSAGNGEQFYVRPHQSGRDDANQYQPLFNGLANWQLYHGPGYSAPVRYRFGEWTHVKIVFSGRKAEFYIDSDSPVFTTAELKQEVAPGRVGVYSSGFAPAWFANFQVREYPAGHVIETPEPASRPAGSLVAEWDISAPFDVAVLDKADSPAALAEQLEWQSLASEPTGLANIGRLHGLKEGTNTVFARVRIDSAEARRAALSLGYSDKVRVYLNGTHLYSGDNTYRTRDFRYLGTIGLFDSVILPLQAGENELLLAVSEQFGGWGVMASLEP